MLKMLLMVPRSLYKACAEKSCYGYYFTRLLCMACMLLLDIVTYYHVSYMQLKALISAEAKKSLIKMFKLTQ